MRILLSLSIALIISLPNTAHASFWVQCKVIAIVKIASRGGVYEANIKSAVITAGHETKGAVCMKGNIGKTIEIKINNDVPTGKEVRLKYEFYNDRTETGVVNEETWSYWPVSLKDMLPW